jgi:hypothetical protein
VPRAFASAIGPLLSGWLVTLSGFAWPLLLAGLLKTGYDLALLAMFSRVRPPEEGAWNRLGRHREVGRSRP